MARTMSSSEAEHECRVSESCSPGENGEVCTGHHHPTRSQLGLCHGHSAKQLKTGSLEDGAPQGLKEKGLLLQPGDEALLEMAAGLGHERRVSIPRCRDRGWRGAETQLLSSALLFACSEGLSEGL